MKTVEEILIGAIIFISIDRLAKVVGSSLVDRSKSYDDVRKASLRIELLTLFISFFIAIHFIKWN